MKFQILMRHIGIIKLNFVKFSHYRYKDKNVKFGSKLY